MSDETVEFSLFLLRKKQVLVLKLPGEGEELEMIMIAKDGEVRCVFQAKSVVSSFEITMKDVIFAPRPYVSQVMLLLDVKQEPFDVPFE